MPTPTQQHTMLSWVERYRPERLFYLLLISVILSAPANLLQSLILQGPASLAPSQWSQLYIVQMALMYPFPATAIALLAVGLAIYGFRLDQRHQQQIAEKGRQVAREEARNQFQPIHEIVQEVADRQKIQDEGILQITKQTSQIQHLVSQYTIPLLPVRYIKPETLNLGDDQSATFPYLSTVYPQVYEQATRILGAALADSQQRGLLVTGAPMAGKTRLAYQAMYACAPDWLTLTWTRGLTAVAIPAPESLADQRIILFLDDLQQYAESERNGDELESTSNEVPLDRLYVTLMQSAIQVVLVATCRSTDLSRAETTSSLRWLFEKVQGAAIPFLSDDQQGMVIRLLKAAKPTMDYHDDDFDGTIGSLLLGLSRKREQYLELKKQRNPGYLVLRAMKVLNVAGIPIQTKQRVRAMAMQALGAQMLKDEVTWSMVCEALEERQFLTQQDTALVLRKDIYFDKVITDYPTQLRDALLQARHVFHTEGDSEALIAIGWVYSERKEFTEMLETSTLAVELAPSNSRAQYAQGAALGYLLRHEEALACFDNALDLDPTFAVGWNNKGYMLDALQRYDEAIIAYEKALQLNPSYARAWYNKGITLWNLQRHEDALTAYEQAIVFVPHFADAWYNKGIVLSKLKRYDEALAAFEAALAATTIDPSSVSGWLNKGQMLIALQRYDEAMIAYEEAITRNPQFADAWYNKGLLLWNLNRFDEALDYFEKALVLNSLYDDAWNSKSQLLWNLNRFDEALVCYDKVLVLNPQSTSTWHSKGDVLIALNRFDEALVCYDKVLVLNPQDVIAWNDKGYVLVELKRYEEALVCYDKALTINPQYDIAWNDKGYVLVELNCYEEAFICYDKASVINPQFPNPWRLKGEALCKLHRYEEALVCYDKALTINPQYTTAWYNKGAALWQLKRNDEACAAYGRAIENDISITLSPEYTHYYEEALAVYDEAIQLNPHDVDAWDKKGIFLYKLERNEEARATYAQAILLNPHVVELFAKKLSGSEEATKLNPQNSYGWYKKGIALNRLGREAEARIAFEEATMLNKATGGWATQGFWKYLSPSMVDDKYLDSEIIIFLEGTNTDGMPVYSYIKLIGDDLKKMFAKMQAREIFKPSDFGTILASGTGEVPQEVRDKMKVEHNTIDVPVPTPEPSIQPKSFDDESN